MFSHIFLRGIRHRVSAMPPISFKFKAPVSSQDRSELLEITVPKAQTQERFDEYEQKNRAPKGFNFRKESKPTFSEEEMMSTSDEKFYNVENLQKSEAKYGQLTRKSQRILSQEHESEMNSQITKYPGNKWSENRRNGQGFDHNNFNKYSDDFQQDRFSRNNFGSKFNNRAQHTQRILSQERENESETNNQITKYPGNKWSENRRNGQRFDRINFNKYSDDFQQDRFSGNNFENKFNNRAQHSQRILSQEREHESETNNQITKYPGNKWSENRRNGQRFDRNNFNKYSDDFQQDRSSAYNFENKVDDRAQHDNTHNCEFKHLSEFDDKSYGNIRKRNGKVGYRSKWIPMQGNEAAGIHRKGLFQSHKQQAINMGFSEGMFDQENVDRISADLMVNENGTNSKEMYNHRESNSSNYNPAVEAHRHFKPLHRHQKQEIEKPVISDSHDVLFGIHPIHLALLAKRRKLHTLFVKQGIEDENPRVKEILRLARSVQFLKIKIVVRNVLQAIVGDRVHQGVCMEVDPLPLLIWNAASYQLSQYLAKVKSMDQPIHSSSFILMEEKPVEQNFPSDCDSLTSMTGLSEKASLTEGVLDSDVVENLCNQDNCEDVSLASTLSNHKRHLWLLLDRINDPMNLGAIIRSAYYFGVDLVLTTKSCCPLTPVASKASSGAIELLPVHQVDDLVAFIKDIKKSSWNVLESTTCDNQEAVHVENFIPSGNILLLVGNEGMGLSDELLNVCDSAITVAGRRAEPGIDSLNVSVATAILLHSLTSVKE